MFFGQNYHRDNHNYPYNYHYHHLYIFYVIRAKHCFDIRKKEPSCLNQGRGGELTQGNARKASTVKAVFKWALIWSFFHQVIVLKRGLFDQKVFVFEQTQLGCEMHFLRNKLEMGQITEGNLGTFVFFCCCCNFQIQILFKFKMIIINT